MTDSTSTDVTPTGDRSPGQQGTMDKAKDVAGQVKDEASGSASDIKDEAASQMSHVGQEAKSHASDVVHQARGKVGEQADQGTRQLADALAAAGRELTSMARSSEQSDGPMTGLVRQLGDRASTMGQSFQEGGYKALAGDLSRFARSSPGLFLLSAAGAGFAVGRIVRNADRQALTEAAKSTSQGSSGSSPQGYSGYPSPSISPGSSEFEPDLPLSTGAPSGVDLGQAGAVITTSPTAEEVM